MITAKPSTLEFLGVKHAAAPADLLVGVKQINMKAIGKLVDFLGLPEIDVARLAGMAERTYQRRKEKKQPLSVSEADAALRIARVVQEAQNVFGDTAKATHWLKTRHALLGSRPIELLSSDAGAQAVQNELTRIHWGDFA